jgi:hypothetical protein
MVMDDIRAASVMRGFDKGKMIARTMENSVAPSMRADSTSERGIESKNERDKRSNDEFTKPGKNTAACVPDKDSLLITTKSGMMIAMRGNRSEDIKPYHRILENRNRYAENAHPAISVTGTVSVTAMRMSFNVFKAHIPTPLWENVQT